MGWAKYVVWEFEGSEEATIIPSHEQHANAPMSRIVLGAGFFELVVENDTIRVKCFGNSVGLDKISRGNEDAQVIARLLKLEWKKGY